MVRLSEAARQILQGLVGEKPPWRDIKRDRDHAVVLKDYSDAALEQYHRDIHLDRYRSYLDKGIRKYFEASAHLSRSQFFNGTVDKFMDAAPPDPPLWRVAYSDGDSEDLNEEELLDAMRGRRGLLMHLGSKMIRLVCSPDEKSHF